MMHHMPADVKATFNVQGKIKPVYIRLEDEEHVLQPYKIDGILFNGEENLPEHRQFFILTALQYQRIILYSGRI